MVSEYPTLKVTYFDVAGRGEMIRLALAIGDIPFTDERISMEEFSNSVKETSLYGALPVLYINDKPYAQSLAILRYVGKLANLYPSDAEEALFTDEMLDLFLVDIANHVLKVEGLEGGEKDTALEKLKTGPLQRLMNAAEKRLKERGEGPWIGEDIGIGDLGIFALCAFVNSGKIKGLSGDDLKGYERAWGIFEAVKGHEKVVQWYEKQEAK